MAKSPYTPDELIEALIHAVACAERPLTRKEICERVGRHKSAHIINVIRRLAYHNWFNQQEGVDKHGRAAYFYTIGERYHQEVLRQAAADSSRQPPEQD